MNAEATLAKHVTMLIRQEWLQMASTFDNVYNEGAAVAVKAPTTVFSSADIGHEFG